MRAFAFLAASLAFPPGLPAFVPPAQEKALPDFDQRRQAPLPQKPLPPAKAAAVDKLKSRVPGLRVEHDSLLQTPKHVASTAGYLTGPNGEGKGVSALRAAAMPANDPHRPIKAFLNEHSPLFGHGAEVLGGSRVKRDFVTSHNGLRTVVWEQQVDDIVVYESVLAGHITRQGELVSLSSQFIPDAERAADAGTPNRAAAQAAPLISAAQAVFIAAENLGETLDLAAITPRTPRPEGNEKRQTFKAGPLPGEAQTRLVWLPLDATRLRLCWEVEVTRRAGGERYRLLVDAQTGEVPLRHRLTVYLSDATYRVFTSDSPTPLSPGLSVPGTNEPPAVSRSLVTLSALDTNASPIGWISDGENETRGNNVDAHLDRNGDDVPDLPRPQGSPFRVFDAPLDLATAPGAYTDAAVVQLFYWCNWIHDRQYELGFTEAAGNYQKDNFGRGGVGNDAIQADAQDGSGFNNANFTPAPDGQPGRVQMFIFTGPDPDRDGDLDAEVMLHELTHGMSSRLVGGGVGISSLQASGMGEGWSDFFALSLLSQPDDDPDGVYPFGGYASFQISGLLENYYFGIRRYPYSTDLSKNPLTFKDIDPAQINPHPGVPINPISGFNPLEAAEVHAQGEVWCVTLWEARANLIRKQGYAVGNELMLRLVTDGMKLSPPNPTFTQARDAIILADQVDHAGANYGDLWAAFAKRGLGFSATAPDTSMTSGVREALDLPDSLFISNPTGFVASGPQAGPFTPSCQSYPLTNISDQPVSWTVRTTQPWITVSATSGTLMPNESTNVLVCLGPNALALPLGNYSDTIVFSNTLTKVAQSRGVEARVVAFTSMPFTEDFESGRIEPYWSVTGTGAHVAQVTTLNSPHGGKYQLTLDAAGGQRARNEFTLGIDLGGYTNVVLDFWAKSFGDEPDGPPPSPFLIGADFDGVAMSEDGLTWYEVQDLRSIPSTYQEYVVDLDAAIAAHGLHYTSTFRIRFNQVDDFQVPFDGLALDDIAIRGVGARRLVMTLPERATEGDGLLAQPGMVTLGAPTPAPVTLRLTSSAPTKVSVPPSITIPAGSDRAMFGLTIMDDSALGGTTAVMIRADVAEYFGGSAVIQVADNEKAVLKVKLPRKTREGDGRRVRQGTVQAHARLARDVVVQLTSSDPGELQVPATVILPAGRATADFDLFVVDDHRIDGARAVTVTAHVDNWVDGSDTMSILDNETSALSLVLPASAAESNGVLTNAGTVRLAGSVPTNLLVTLFSSDSTALRVPAAVSVPAGQLEANFDLVPVDNTGIDGLRSVRVSAQAPGFSGAAATMNLIDDETPPVPLQPRPADHATNAPISLSLVWNPGVGNILVNGGFETGDFTGWATAGSGYGSWVLNDGKLDPDGPDDALAPLQGKFNAMTDQIGSGQHLLWQDVFIPPDSVGATLSWSDRIHNHAVNFTPDQEFRVEIRDTNNNVLAVAYATQDGDPFLNDWKPRAYDLSRFRGQTVRIGFFEQDSIGYFNAHVDEVTVHLAGPETPTTFDVYFGTTPTLGPTELRGSTTNAFWALPALALNSKYYWQIVARRGAASARGPVWQFNTRGVGAVNHFEWGRIASPQYVDQRFAATITAKDDINNTVKNFNGAVTVTGLPGSGTASTVVMTELDIGNNDRVEFANVSAVPVNISGWQVTVYDVVSWPAPLTTVTVPAGTVCAPGALFQLNDNGEAPGQFPNLNAGTNVNWSLSALGNPIAVLLRDAGGSVVDFVCAGTADPGMITSPIPIPASEWSGPPIFAALPTFTQTLQRMGHRDQNDRSDWTAAIGSFGALNPGLSLPFSQPPTIALTPVVLTNFVTGVWAGFLAVQEGAPAITLRAEDGQGHLGEANEFAVGAANDLGVSVADFPDVVILGDPLLYRVTVTNSGPAKATGIVLTNLLPPAVNFVSVATFDGVCDNHDGLVVCQLHNLSAGDSALLTISALPMAPGLLTNVATVARAETDGYAPNNLASAVTTVTGPSISTTNVNVNEGNSSTNMVRVPVRLSAPCRLPVSVQYATSNLTALAGSDYVARSGTLIFDPGVTNLTVEVPILGDLIHENLETFFVVLSAPSNGVIVVPQARCRITDDDPSPRVSIDDVTVTEGAPGATNEAVFRVRLSAPSALTAQVEFTTVDGTAVAPADYLTTFGTLTFPPGTTNQTIHVPIRGDNRFEPTETFGVTLSSPVGSLLSRSQALGTILDDDSSELDHFIWNDIASPQYAGAPFLATLTARDGLDRTATAFSGLVTLRGVADSREVTVGAGTNLWEYPLGTLYHDARTQVIYLPEELGSAGKINALALQVAGLPGQPLTNWTIRLKHTSMPGYAQAAWESTGWTTAYQNNETVLAPGWVTFLFATPFGYDGTNSLLVDFSFNNSTYSVNGLCLSTGTARRRAAFFQTDSAFGDPLGWSGTTAPPPSMLDRIPNVRFFLETPVAILPSGTIQVTNGIWSGPVIVPEAETNVFLRASDTSGHIANGNRFAVDSSADADGDGLPDAWEIRYFGSTQADPAADPDGDGLDNLHEFRAGTNPMVASGLTVMQTVQMRGSDVVIRFSSVNGMAYRLERAVDFPPRTWTTVVDGITGTGGVVEAMDRGAAGGANAFYRLRVSP